MTIAEKLQTIYDNVPKVYEAGKAEGIEQGKKSQYDEFWDTYQDYGNRRNYAAAFGGQGWNDATFKPKYDIVVENPDMTFGQWCAITDLGKALKASGVTYTLNTTQFGRMFQNFTGEVISGIIHNYEIRAMSYSFYGCQNLVRIDYTIPLSSTGACSFDRVFVQCYALEHLRLSGVIGKNGFDVKDCTKLSKESIESIINALSTSTSGLTVTLSKTAVDTAFETSVGAKDGSTSAEWKALADTRPNWTKSLS